MDIITIVQSILSFVALVSLIMAIISTVRKNSKDMKLFWSIFAVTGAVTLTLYGKAKIDQYVDAMVQDIAGPVVTAPPPITTTSSSASTSTSTTSVSTEAVGTTEEISIVPEEEPKDSTAFLATFDDMSVGYSPEDAMAFIIISSEEYNADNVGCRTMAVMLIMDKTNVTDYKLVITNKGVSVFATIIVKDGEIISMTGLPSDVHQGFSNSSAERVSEEMLNILEQWAQINGESVTTTSQTSLPDEKETDNVPTEYLSALRKAESYSEHLHMSKADIYDQLVSKYGGGFSEEAAQWAIDNIVADWYANALAKAESYNEHLHMSKADLYDQLVSEYGGQFTPEEAQYAIDNIKADWKENALIRAQSYSDNLHLSKAGVYDQLVSKYGGQFMAEEAQYAIDNLNVDWKKNALARAISYQDKLSMSPARIYEQLISEYGGQFTEEEAQYAIDHLP